MCLFFRDLESRMEIEHSSVELAGPDIYGQVKPGPQNYLRVSAPVLYNVCFISDTAESKDRGAAAHMDRGFPFITYQGRNLRVAVLHIDNDLDQDTDDYIHANQSCLAFLVVGFSPGGDTHEVLMLTSITGKPNTFERMGVARLGLHFREPKEHGLLIDQAPREAIILV